MGYKWYAHCMVTCRQVPTVQAWLVLYSTGSPSMLKQVFHQVQWAVVGTVPLWRWLLGTLRSCRGRRWVCRPLRTEPWQSRWPETSRGTRSHCRWWACTESPWRSGWTTPKAKRARTCLNVCLQVGNYMLKHKIHIQCVWDHLHKCIKRNTDRKQTATVKVKHH